MIDKKKAYYHAQMPQYKKLVMQTEKFITRSLERVINPYLACSFGKDSAVMLHLVLKQMPNIRVLFAYSDETWTIDNYKEVITEWQVSYNINLYQVYCKREADGRTHSAEKMTNYFENYDSYFVGLRNDESKGRAASLKYQGLFYKNKDGKARICPIGNWTNDDIIAYIVDNDLPLLDTYKHFGENARTTAAIPTIGKQRALANLKRRDISAYNKLNRKK